ncbi:MAG: response regulator [Pedobacter sp.]|nr:MAG: response regulator [Pedobacter sp.]
MKRILVVDDDVDILETIQLILEIGGYEVEPLLNAEELFDRIHSFKPNLIILDIALGKLDGRLLCSQIKSSPKTNSIPVLLMSALYDSHDISLMQDKPDDFMAKPFKMDVLLKKIERLADQHKIQQYNIN